MPKDKVVTAAGPGTYAEGLPWVQVGWARNRDVQIAVLRQEEHDPNAQWMDLDREGINKLIRILRKARDQAYGADA